MTDRTTRRILGALAAGLVTGTLAAFLFVVLSTLDLARLLQVIITLATSIPIGLLVGRKIAGRREES